MERLPEYEPATEPFEVPPIFVCEAIAQAVMRGRMTAEEADECVQRYLYSFGN